MTCACCGGHDGTYQNADQATSESENQAQIVDHGERSVGKQDAGGRRGRHNEVNDQDIPPRRLVFLVIEPVHCEDLVGHDRTYARRAKDPGKEVEPARLLLKTIVSNGTNTGSSVERDDVIP